MGFIPHPPLGPASAESDRSRSLRTERLLRSRIIEYPKLEGTHNDLQSLTLLPRRRWNLTREALLTGLEITRP